MLFQYFLSDLIIILSSEFFILATCLVAWTTKFRRFKVEWRLMLLFGFDIGSRYITFSLKIFYWISAKFTMFYTRSWANSPSYRYYIKLYLICWASPLQGILHNEQNAQPLRRTMLAWRAGPGLCWHAEPRRDVVELLLGAVAVTYVVVKPLKHTIKHLLAFCR